MNSSVPTEWITDELARFCDIVGGGTPDRAVHEYWGGQILWVSPTEVTFLVSKYISKTTESLTQLGLDKSSAKLHPPGTLLMTSRASIGYVAINTVPMATNQGFQSLRCKDGTLTDYMYQYITWVRPELERLSAGSTFSEISSVNVKRLRVTLPPLPEQQKIATILSSVDNVIEKTRAQIDKLKDLKTGMMQELLTKGIGHTEFKDSPVGRIPASWEVKTLGEVCSFTQGVQIPSSEMTREFKNGYIRYMYIRDFSSDDYLWYVKNEHFSKIITADDLAMANTGHTSGTVYKGKYGVLSNNAFKISFDKKILNTEFVYYFLQSEFFLNKIQQLFNTAGQPHVGHGNIAKMPTPIPSIDEQYKIAESINKIVNARSKLEAKLDHLNALKKALMQDLLTGKVRVNLTDKESAVV